MGDRLRPAARLLAQKIMDGTAGDVPAWGYKILACAPDEVIEILTPRLADTDIVEAGAGNRRPGAYGAAAAPAIERVKAAMGKASTDREKRLLPGACGKSVASEERRMNLAWSPARKIGFAQ